MSRNYYYTICSLPLLSFDAGRARLPWDDFLRLCAVEVSGGKMELLRRLGLIPDPDMQGRNPVLDRWFIFEGGMRNSIARFRARRLELPEEEVSRSAYPVDVSDEAVQGAVRAETPLDAEARLDRIRWDRLDTMDLASDFGLGRLIVYGLKLRLLERRDRFDRKAGEAVLQQATDISPAAVETGVSGRTS